MEGLRWKDSYKSREKVKFQERLKEKEERISAIMDSF